MFVLGWKLRLRMFCEKYGGLESVLMQTLGLHPPCWMAEIEDPCVKSHLLVLFACECIQL